MDPIKITHTTDKTVRIAGWGIVFGGADLAGETFSPTTDFKLDWQPHPPVLYDHTLNEPQEALGHVVRMVPHNYGLWIEAELDRSREYTAAVLELIEQGVLGFSTGSAGHLVRYNGKSIVRWPILEVSLTTTPCEPRTLSVAAVRRTLIRAGMLPDALDNVHGNDNGTRNGYDTRNRNGNGNDSSDTQKGFDRMDTAATTTTAVPQETTTEPRTVGIEPRTAVHGHRTSSPDAMTQPGTGEFDSIAQRIGTIETTVQTLRTMLEHTADPPVPVAGYIVPDSTPSTNNPAYTERMAKAWNAYVRRGDRAALKAALQEATPSEGGYLVPDLYSSELVTALTEASIVRRAGARVLRVAGTDMLRVPAMSQSSAAVITSEEAAFGEVEPTFGEITFVPTKFTKLVKVSDELVEDSRIDLMRQVLLPDFAQAFAQAENFYFATGSGTGQPQGITVGASNSNVTTASATTISADNIIDTYHALGYLYRQNAVWLMHDTTIKALRKLKESTTGHYLWQPGLTAGQPDTILGRPVYAFNSMPELGTTGNRIIVFGDLSYFWIVDFGTEALRRLDELYAGTGQIGFRAYRRVDSHVVLSHALVYMSTGA